MRNHLVTVACCISLASSAGADVRIGGRSVGDVGQPKSSNGNSCQVLQTCNGQAEPARPGGVAYDGTFLWVAYYGEANTIYKIDPITCNVVHTIQGPSDQIGGLAWDGAALWCVPEQTGQIFRLNPVDGSVLSTIPAPSFGEGDPNPGDIAWDGANLWHVDYGHQLIYKLDPADGDILATFAAPGPCGSGLSFFDNVLAVGDCVNDTIYYVDATDGTVLFSCASPGSHPWGSSSQAKVFGTETVTRGSSI